MCVCVGVCVCCCCCCCLGAYGVTVKITGEKDSHFVNKLLRPVQWRVGLCIFCIIPYYSQVVIFPFQPFLP